MKHVKTSDFSSIATMNLAFVALSWLDWHKSLHLYLCLSEDESLKWCTNQWMKWLYSGFMLSTTTGCRAIKLCIDGYVAHMMNSDAWL